MRAKEAELELGVLSHARYIGLTASVELLLISIAYLMVLQRGLGSC